MAQVQVEHFENGRLVSTDTVTVPDSAVNRDMLFDRAQQGLTANANFLALASPTNAQVAAQVKTLTRECSALIRLLIGALDDITGT